MSFRPAGCEDQYDSDEDGFDFGDNFVGFNEQFDDRPTDTAEENPLVHSKPDTSQPPVVMNTPKAKPSVVMGVESAPVEFGTLKSVGMGTKNEPTLIDGKIGLETGNESEEFDISKKVSTSNKTSAGIIPSLKGDLNGSTLFNKNDSAIRNHKRYSPVTFKIASDDPESGENGDITEDRSIFEVGYGFPLLKPSGRHKQSLDKGVRSKSQLKSLEISQDLKVAVMNGNLKQVKMILDDGWDPNLPLNSGWPPLLHACESCQEPVIKLLLDKGVNPNTSKDGLTALMVVCMSKPHSLHDRVEYCARLLVDRGAQVNVHDRYRMTPLLYACQSCHIGVVEYLISVKANVNAQDVRGWSPLFFAASKGHTPLLRLLIKSGSNLNIVCNLGESPYSIALSNNHTATADWLDTMASSKQSDESISSHLPLHPLLSDKLDDSNSLADRPHTSPGTKLHSLSPSKASVKTILGDLEMFLVGLHLMELIPVFQDHKIEFTQLLSLTDADLQQMGVTKVGSRKKILNGILEVHKMEWKMPENSLPYSRPINSAELSMMLCNLARHTQYLQGSAHFLLTHVKSDPDILGPHVEPSEAKKLFKGLKETMGSLKNLQNEVNELYDEAQSNLPVNVLQSDVSDQVSRGRRMPLLIKTVLGVGVLACLSLGICHYLNRHL